MTEKTVQPGEENCHSHTGQIDRSCGTQEGLVRIIYHQETQIWGKKLNLLSEIMKYLF